MSFLQLAIVSIAALAGPLLAAPQRWHVPVMVGELLVGVLLGATGFRILDAGEPVFSFLASIGFALIMFVAGSHVPVRDPHVRSALGAGFLRFLLVAAAAAAVGIGIAFLFRSSDAPLFIVLLASSSAALVLPIIDSLRLSGPAVLTTMAQVAIADVVCSAALPLVIDPPRAGETAIGIAAVLACAVVLYFLMRAADRTGLRQRLSAFSTKRKFALDLRIDLSILFLLAAVAVSTRISVMLAGFAFGIVVAAVGEPRRLAKQIFALADGFLGPLFFVWLGASLNLTGLLGDPAYAVLGLALGAGAVLTHLAGRALGGSVPLGLLASAQLGIPVAAVTIGTQLDVLSGAEAAALLLGALVTIAVSTVGGARQAYRGASAGGTEARTHSERRSKPHSRGAE
jgi:Kef-type K+ transport system membrane component KefB